MSGLELHLAHLDINPVLLKELRARMRGSRAFLILTVYVGALGLVVGLVLLGFSLAQDPYSGNPNPQTIGKTIFSVVVGLELLTLSFVAPALTASAIASERERQTFDLLRTTLLPGRMLVGGKLLGALAFLFLLLLAAFPLQSLGLLFGGLTAPEILIATLLLACTALLFCSAGLFFSSLTRRTLIATVLSYAFAGLSVYGLPVLVFGILLIGSRLFTGGFGSGDTSAIETALIIFGWLLVSTNPLGVAIVTEVILINDQSLWFTHLPMSNGTRVLILSPWMSYLVFCLLVSLVLLLLSVRFVNRWEK